MASLNINDIRLIYVDNKILARLYTGKTTNKGYVDATVTPECLANMISDGAKMLPEALRARR